MTQHLIKKPLYLASTSPRRKELLEQLNLDFDVVNAPVEEVALPHENPESYVRRIAIEKALAGFNKVAGKIVWVIGGDTAVLVAEQEIDSGMDAETRRFKVLGKPKNQADSYRMLSMLSGRSHQVLSATAVVFDGEVFSTVNTTKVHFKALTDDEIKAYISTGEPQDKAGSYAIQGLAAKFITRIEGSYSGVMGLPLFELNELLTQSGYYSN
ncbi:Maf-like protein [Thiomicrorhabdus immobilis]|uniref:dTTP/UTP pyrophosphatase n=1 Tax=Thiomicrorhabdus immobilis TaxID=2791037 RepID=A0ABN6CZ98_9GAMM|nr:Maf family protein [Thiomicrorhabdus immobilis]BCN93939.1 Maf-like protein [Thiomicrorhabdus immobilis]